MSKDLVSNLLGTAFRASGRKSVGQLGEAVDRCQAVVRYGPDGGIVDANPAFLALSGYALDELVGRHQRTLLDPADAETPQYTALWDGLRRGEPHSGEYRLSCRDGGEAWLQGSLVPVRDAAGKTVAVIQFGSDCTGRKQRQLDHAGQIAAIDRSQAVIEFTLDGTILRANDNFLHAVGYALDEIQGRHHRLFVDPEYAGSAEYKAFWQKLGRGEFHAGEYRRLRKDGSEIWIQASYNPVFDTHGRPCKIVKYATDITERRLRSADHAGQIEAIGRSQAVIEFTLDGTILYANDNFLGAVGYTLDEIQGRHHRLFVDPDYAASAEYAAFWEKLGRGEYHAGEYRRIRKDGSEIWIQASYNPILDMNGRPFKIVKYATDITAQKLQNADHAGQIEAIGKSQAVIEFDMDGTIRHANENFLNAVGYRLDEIVGRHHRLFVDPDYASSAEYVAFWEKLDRGEFHAGEYRRIGKGGREIWIQASYNPILDMNGRPFKVVKYATDVTAQKALAITIERCLGEVREVMGGMAEGDLTRSVTGAYTGDFDTLKHAVNATVEKLRAMVNEITEAADSISVSASEIAVGNTDLSERTSKQAASLEETAASVAELDGTVRQNAGNAGDANRLASSAHDAAKTGGSVIAHAIQAMAEISAASKQIGAIVNVIDEIAFQTNLLALNASVEAARAGEQGRGFAVVATEVRNLAQRSAGSAREIRALIRDSVAKVDEGSRLVNESGESLGSIVDSVGKVAGIVGAIAAATEEQSLGVSQVNQAITQIDDVTQQNAALVEEAAAASQSLGENASNLRQLVGFFKSAAH
jgi:methyl-accepting chemotaxis protein